jgi:prepilin-type N-terminal cleavage/methylation domain-containing protein
VSTLRQQRGFTLIELLMVMSLLSVVVGATVALFTGFLHNDREVRLQNEAQDQARLGLGALARELRNLASPKDNEPKAVESAGSYDVLFKTVDPIKPNGSTNPRNIKRVRYCLGQSSGGSAILWLQQQTWTAPNPPPGIPSMASCPDKAWGNQREVARDVVNREEELPVFSFVPGPAPLEAIKSIRSQLAIDVNPGKQPVATKLASGVFLRNQNRAPVASCTATYAGSDEVVLNGSGSEDPEGHPLVDYAWYFGAPDDSPDAKGIVAQWTVPGPGLYSFSLKVKDHGNLTNTSSCQVEVK